MLGYQILEARRLVADQRPVEVIMLLCFLHRAEPRCAGRRETEDRVEMLEDRYPATDRLVTDL